MYKPKYNQSWALVIGINDYLHASPLGYAVNDARRFADLLIQTLGFSKENVTLLVDEEATGTNIRKAYLSYTGKAVDPDDRLVVFFAGHGLTRSGRRGEVGYLVPHDGVPDDLDTLVRWDSLTRDADLILAKHILFIMDACYGGLAVTRALTPGTQRFLNDMLVRYSRQVLTAGKADEVVADAGGPRPGHSVFTGHLLNALEGEARTPEGVLSANLIMAYVYDRVAKDPNSRQTPHYGFIDGDGDFIFSEAPDTPPSESGGTDADVLVQVPPNLIGQDMAQPMDDPVETLKTYLGDPRDRIKLHDMLMGAVRSVLHNLSPDHFPVTGAITGELIATRLKEYETAVGPLLPLAIQMGRWGSSENLASLSSLVVRLGDSITERGGVVGWTALRWYPLSLVSYCTGISALSGDNYSALATLFNTPIGTKFSGTEYKSAVRKIGSGIGEADSYEIFKHVPGHERHYTPRSEYTFKAIQPVLEDHLYLGSGYEELFDRFEILWALAYADNSNEVSESVWGPVGRFGWKYRRDGGPFIELVNEAKVMGDRWPPLMAGMFRGSVEHFLKLAEAYRLSLLNKLSWF